MTIRQGRRTMKANINNGLRVLLLASVSTFAATAPQSVMAQSVVDEQQIGEQGAQSGEIVVTGSRLRGVAPVGSSVIALGADDVAASGAVTTDRLIRQIPQVFDLGVSENSRGQSGGSGNITYGNRSEERRVGNEGGKRWEVH